MTGTARDMPWLQPAWDRFRGLLDRDRLAHALLLHGPEGCGKAELAKRMVRRLLCGEPAADGACGQCLSCQSLLSGAHPDAFMVTFIINKNTGKLNKEIKIDQIRELIDSLSLTTTISERKVALIAPADFMNRNAANALLKTLEEPPGNAVIILLAHQPSRLPVTIRSRCQSLNLAMPGTAVAEAWLVENQNMDQKLARESLQAAGGSPLRALHMNEQGLIALYHDLDAALDVMFSGKDAIAEVLSLVGDNAPDVTWRWLSEACARRLHAVQPHGQLAMDMLELQNKADRSRRLSRSSVRGDLLMRDWLIEWCRAGALARR